MRHVGFWLIVLAGWLACAQVGVADEPSGDAEKLEFFEKRIRPVFVEHCIECHGPKKQFNELRLDTRKAILDGGYSGPAIDLEHPEESILVSVLRHEELEMPPENKLPDSVADDFLLWIQQGAVDPRTEDKTASPTHQATDHWAFQPLQSPPLPEVKQAEAVRTPVDQFILAHQEAAGITANPAAERRALIRRATFDLTGLPPTPDEVEAFVADASPDAFARVVERLLASPHYGERWGRHWLDVVRYADTAGETADFPAPHAWRYRNYVIDAFNKDKPYDQFLREQLAGDLLAASAPPEQYAELVTATGYLAISRRFGFDSTADHYLTIEDTIDTLGKSMLGLTVACARCHNHKYDPIPAADYYGLYGIFASTQYAFPGCEKEKQPRDMVPLVSPAEFAQRQAEQQQRTAAKRSELEQAQQALVPLHEAVRQAWLLPTTRTLEGRVENGHDAELPSDQPAWAVRPGDLLQLAVLPNGDHGADSTTVELEIQELGGAGRTWNLTTDILAASTSAPTVWRTYDLETTPRPLERHEANAYAVEGLHIFRGAEELPAMMVNRTEATKSFVTVTLPPRSLALHPGPRGGVAVAWCSPIAGQVSVRGRIADADDAGGDGIVWRLEHRTGLDEPLAQLRASLTRVAELEVALAAVELPPVDVTYGVREGTPANVRIHKRGEPNDPGDEAPRKFLEVLGGQLVSEDAGSGRLQLAEWITDPKNPLTARVYANRVWQHHFGRPLVATPNDFGLRGTPPTHPELLDYLASELIRSGWSTKHLHRLIMLSATYQQSSEGSAEAEAIDSTNELFWCADRRRLDAEQIRDSLLAVSGRLDRTPGEAHPFPPESTWNFTQHGPFNATYPTDKRSVYLMVQRIRRHPFLALFDGADTNASTAERTVSTVAPQALFFLNDPLVHELAGSLADRLIAHSADAAARVDLACRLLYGRPASAADQNDAGVFITEYLPAVANLPAEQQHAEVWRAYARVLLASNEFLYTE